MHAHMQSCTAGHEHDFAVTNLPKEGLGLCPSLYQINTRVLMHELGQDLGRSATLDDIPDDYIDHLAQQGYDWVWFLGVWQTGPAGRKVSREKQEWRREFREAPGNVFPGNGKQRWSEGRVAELERKIGQQVLEIDFLKGCLQRIEEQRMLQALTGNPRSSARSAKK